MTPRTEAHAARMRREHCRPQPARGVFVRRRLPWPLPRGLAPAAAAEMLGYRHGLGDRHYLPLLKFATSAEWLAWLTGWRRGQADLCREREALGYRDGLAGLELSPFGSFGSAAFGAWYRGWERGRTELRRQQQS